MPRHAQGGAQPAIRTLIVDDSAVVRGAVSRALDADPAVTVTGTVPNGQRALDVLAETPVDVVILDIEMPVMDGLTALPEIKRLRPKTQVLIASTLSQPSAEPTVRALEAGAADYVPKPTAGVAGSAEPAADFRKTLLAKVRALGPEPAQRPQTDRRAGAAAVPATPRQPPHRSGPAARPSAIGIGSSTGGPQALFTVLDALAGVEQPILVTQHMPATFTQILAQNIAKHCGLPAGEARDGERLEGGRVYVAPGGYHLSVDGDPRQPRAVLQDSAPCNYCKPSVDPMLKSMVAVWGRRVLAAILTGMGQDGLAGCQSVHRAGGTVLAQDHASSVVWGMPGAVTNAGIADAVVPLAEIGRQIRQSAGEAKSARA